MKHAATDKEFTRMTGLLAQYSEAENDLAALEATVNDQHLALINRHRDEYARLQGLLTEAGTELEKLATEHPQWFASDRKSVRTPYGTVKFHKSTSLEVPNPEATILLIERDVERGNLAGETYIRQTKELDLESLGHLDDATLKKYRIVRVTRDNFSVKAAKLDMGKAMKEAATKEEKVAK